MLSVRYKSVEQQNENNLGRASGERSSDTVVILFMNHPSIPADRMFPIVLKNWIESPLPCDGLAPSKSVPLAPTHRVLACSPFQPATTIFWLRGSVHAPFTPCTTRLRRQSPVWGPIHTERMPDLRNRAAVNNREMKRTRCLFAKIRDRGRSVPLYAACRVWRCDRYMDGIMEGEGRGGEKKGKNRGKKNGNYSQTTTFVRNGQWCLGKSIESWRA